VNSEAKRILRETTFREQIQMILAIEIQLENRWVIQKFEFDKWCGIKINTIIPDDPISEAWPMTGTPTYATSGEALEVMQKLQAQFPDVPMQVSPVEEDILAAHLSPGRPSEQQRYGRYPKCGELLQKHPHLRNVRVDHVECSHLEAS
jgi:hypothetical protein